MEQRCSGVLLPLFSLPGQWGIGTMGADARTFIDFLASAGQRWWQLLPLCPVGAGNSPYSSPAAFDGEPLYLDLQSLYDRGLISRVELEGQQFGHPDRVDYELLRRRRTPLLRLAAARSGEEDFLQKEFVRQWQALRGYAHSRGVYLLGDLPIYPAPDGKEVQQNPELFLRDKKGNLSPVAGAPPDAFSPTGQLWGNPLYDWQGRREQVFDWWEKRIVHAAGLYDGVRIDHFRGLHAFWAVPAGAKSALEGTWLPGPGQALIDRLKQAAPDLRLIAEDLGDLSGGAREFTDASGVPGMKVLLYAFDGENSPYLPHNCTPRSVMYTGTHDTPTFVQWLFEQADPAQRAFATDYLRLREDEGWGWGAVRGAWATGCTLAMAPLQDILGLGGDARLNTPGTVGGHNWSWRVRGEALNAEVAGRLRHLTGLYGRLVKEEKDR